MSNEDLAKLITEEIYRIKILSSQQMEQIILQFLNEYTENESKTNR